MRTNFDVKLQKPSKMSDISNETNFLWIFEAAIVLLFAKNCANPRKVGRNFERHFTDSSEFSQINSKRASKFRRQFWKVLKKSEDCFEISKCLWPEDRDCCVSHYWNAICCVLMQIYYTCHGQLQLLYCPKLIKEVLNGKILCFWRPNL